MIPCPVRVALVLAILALQPAMAATFTVTNTNDSGTGSLRWAIGQANAAAGADLIHFNISGSGVRLIQPMSPLPAITGAVVIDGTTQPGYVGTPLIELNAIDAGAFGFDIAASNVHIRGLAVNRAYSGAGIRVGSGNNVQISECWIGLDGMGGQQGNGGGIRIDAGTLHVIGPGNVISGNSFHGVRINAGASGVTVRGNRIGTNPAGTESIGNSLSGVSIAGSSNNLIGGTTAADLNVISGNNNHGVVINGGTGNRLERNYIGTDATGNAAIGNLEQGVHVLGGADNVIGGGVAGTFNVISGNSGDGVRVEGGAQRTLIQRNVIGMRVAGTVALGNRFGVFIDGATATQVGTGAFGSGGNLIAGNRNSGVLVVNGSHDTFVQGNRIGTDVDGTTAVGNGSSSSGRGVSVHDSSGVRIGGSGLGNLISGHGDTGVVAYFVTQMRIEGNFIGTNAAGTAALGNDGGVAVFGSPHSPGACNDVVIGGTFGSTGNLISGNHTWRGIDVSHCSALVIRGNRIGTAADGGSALPNLHGIIVGEGIDGVVGGTAHGAWTCDGACNLLAGNTGTGLYIGSTVSVLGNFIGVRLDGNAALANRWGVLVHSPAAIGGVEAGAGNLISGNLEQGIDVAGLAHSNPVVIQGNRIGTNRTGTTAIGNGIHGVTQWWGDLRFEIGGADHDAGVCNRACNVIAGNSGDGVLIRSDQRRAHRVQGNFIGVNVSGACLGNGGSGVVLVAGSAVGAMVGGPTPAEGNRIGCNQYGVVLAGENADTTLIRHNSLHNNVQLGIDLRGSDHESEGVTPNDPGDGDSGANGLQNFPVMGGAVTTGSSLSLSGTLNSRASRAYTLDFYASPQCHASGHGEGRTPLGSVQVTTNGSGNASFSTTLGASVTVGQAITATATDNALGATSEFSACISAAAPQPGTLAFSSSTYSVNENAGNVVVTVVRSNGSDGSVGVSYATANGTATAPADYSARSGTLAFAAGEASKTISIPIVDDALHELNETFTVALSNATGGAALGSPSSTTVTIIDNDPAPTLSVDNGGCTVTEGDSGSIPCNFVIRLSTASGRSTQFTTNTTGVTAVSGQDYSGHANTARSIPAGQTSLTVAVPVLGDLLHEDTETFTFRVHSVQGAGPSQVLATGTIIDNDPAPTLSVDNGGCSVIEGDSGSRPCAFVLRLSAVSGLTATFNTHTADGTATAGLDYQAHGSTARSIAAGQTTLTVNVPVLGDTIPEDDETFFLHVQNVQHATPGSLSATGTILDDDLPDGVFMNGFED
ncbi:MAG TPA: Calx-beta domain-containing protein [Xanthomonadaceae bacterium]|nr:Calx-beta domain-containing protein [Xanthomonadaceae bacterium]